MAQRQKTTAKRARPLKSPSGGETDWPAGSAPSGAMLGFEKKLWRAAAKLRNNMNAAEYEHVVLALKHVSDAFEQKHAAHEGERTSGAGQERDAYRAKNNFWVPKEPCRSFLETTAKQPMTVADALLPRLLAGDLQVRAAARELEATV